MSRPLVSIVTPSHNQAAFLEETIRSVLEQDYEPIEYIVVDGASSDGSQDFIRRYAERLAWWVSEPDGGQPAALNKGFARARGEYLAYLNSDDTLQPGAIGLLVGALERDRGLALAYGDTIFIDERSAPIAYGRSREWTLASMVRTGGTVMQPASLWRRSAWERAGPFDEGYHRAFDTLFFLRMATFGRAIQLPEPLATFRIHPRSKTSDVVSLAHAEECISVADGFFGSGDLPLPLRLYARSGRAAYYRQAAWTYHTLGALERGRRLFLRSLLMRPVMSRRTAAKMLRTLVPHAVVRLRRARRQERAASARRPPSTSST